MSEPIEGELAKIERDAVDRLKTLASQMEPVQFVNGASESASDGTTTDTRRQPLVLLAAAAVFVAALIGVGWYLMVGNDPEAVRVAAPDSPGPDIPSPVDNEFDNDVDSVSRKTSGPVAGLDGFRDRIVEQLRSLPEQRGLQTFTLPSGTNTSEVVLDRWSETLQIDPESDELRLFVAGFHRSSLIRNGQEYDYEFEVLDYRSDIAGLVETDDLDPLTSSVLWAVYRSNDRDIAVTTLMGEVNGVVVNVVLDRELEPDVAIDLVDAFGMGSSETAAALSGYTVLTESHCSQYKNLGELYNARIEDLFERNRCVAELNASGFAKGEGIFDGTVGFRTAIVNSDELREASQDERGIIAFDVDTPKANVVVIKSIVPGYVHSAPNPEASVNQSDVAIAVYSDAEFPESDGVMVTLSSTAQFQAIEELVSKNEVTDD